MKKSLLLVIVFGLIQLVNLPAMAAPPQTMNFQGYLKSIGGAPVTGNRTLIFSIYTVSTGGAALWIETHTSVTVTKGQFSVVLGQGIPTPVPLTLAFDVPYWLGVKVSGEAAEMSPRQPLTSVPYAFRAKTADSVSGLALADGSVTAAKLDTAYVKKGGDSMTGALVLPANGLTVGTNQLAVSAGKVGIGTAAPAEVLDVAGNVRVLGTGGTGIYGQTSAANGTGIYGYGSGYGIQGLGSSTVATSVGVDGSSTLGTGVAGRSSSGVGVKGTSTGSYGVYGASTNGYGVYAASTSSVALVADSTNSTGIWGISANNVAIDGMSTSSTGVKGRSASGKGVEAYSSTNTAMHANSTSGYGTYSYSNNSVGIVGESTNSTGIWGISRDHTAIDGFSTFSNGVTGRSDWGYGMEASSRVNTAMYAHSLTGIGVRAESGTGTGLRGISQSPTAGIGVEGVSDSAGGYGVRGQSTSGTGVVGWTSTGNAGWFFGNVHVDGRLYATRVHITSDERFKQDIHTLTNPLDTVSRLRGVSYGWRTGEYPEQRFDSGRHIGLIAQEVEQVVPELVVTDDTGYKSVEYANMVGVLVEAVKELKAQNESLRARVQALEIQGR